MSLSIQSIVEKFNLFWQYPVITELTFYNQNKENPLYIGFPWATIIDNKRYKGGNKYVIEVLKHLENKFDKNLENYTCCQHICFRDLIPFFVKIGIKKVYCPHKRIGEDEIQGIKIIACPLYAVNVEDKKRSILNEINEEQIINKKRKYKYSFIGAYKYWYLTDIRKRIFKLKRDDDCYIKNIGSWHFEKVVYSKFQNKKGHLNENKSDKDRTKHYCETLIDSKFSLCPSGTGPSTIRFWESLAYGSIPILLSDGMELPTHELWDKTIIRLKENELETVNDILEKITPEEELSMRQNCLKIYSHFKNNYKNKI